MSDSDTALKRFDTVSRYYSFETTMYWARSHFFMVANAGLLAFSASRLLEPTVDHPYLLMVDCAFGAIMSLCWCAVLRSGQYWTDRWERICLSIEPAAMGEIEMFRNCRPAGHVSTKGIARFTSFVFFVAWCASAVWVFANYKMHDVSSVPIEAVGPTIPPQSK